MTKQWGQHSSWKPRHIPYRLPISDAEWERIQKLEVVNQAMILLPLLHLSLE